MSKIINLPDNQSELTLNRGSIVFFSNKKPVALISKLSSGKPMPVMAGYYTHDFINAGNIGGQIRMFFKRHAAVIMGEIPVDSINQAMRRGWYHANI